VSPNEIAALPAAVAIARAVSNLSGAESEVNNVEQRCLPASDIFYNIQGGREKQHNMNRVTWSRRCPAL
jgi:hypothetical protein